MAESWRNILERAADNLSIELDRRPAQPYGNPRPPMRRPREPAASLHSFAQSRDMLARELQAISEPPRERMTQAPSPPPAAPRVQTLPVLVKKARPVSPPAPARKRSAWRNVLVTLVSASITVASSYLVLGPKILHPVLNAEAVNFMPRAASEPAPAPVKSAPTVVLSRETEDALLERASNQMAHGDGAGARAVYEVLAHYGSPKGAFSLAETYDPAVLAKRPARGLEPDMALAREWYSKAAELGSMTAYARLKEFDRQGGERR
jgi:hypothetical protein